MHYVVLLPSLGCCLARGRTRTGHGFSDEPAAEQVHRQFAAAGTPARHLVTGDSDDPATTAAGIRARIGEGSLIYRRA